MKVVNIWQSGFQKRRDKIVEFNPHETIKKGVIAKKIAMDKLPPFENLFQVVQNSETATLLWQE